MRLKIGVKSVVSGLKRTWSSTSMPILGRQAAYPASSGVVQAASSLKITPVLMWSWVTSRSFAASQVAWARKAEAR